MSQSHRFLPAARTIALLTLCSRILGLVREMVFSHFFGASPFLSAYRIAFQVPNLARRLFGEGALASSFIPIFTRCRQADGDEAAQRLAGGVLTLLVAILTAILIVVEAGLLIAGHFVGGFTLSLTALLMPYMLLICLTAFFGGLLNALNRFAAPAMAPMLLNICVIFAAWFGGSVLRLQPAAHLRLVGYGVLLAGALQLGVQILWLRAIRYPIRIHFRWSDRLVRRIIVLMAPMVVGMSAVQINTFADSLIALWFVPDGKGPAILGYAQYLYLLPLGVFGTALATALFPLLSQRAAQQDRSGFTRAVEHGLRATLVVAIPASVGLILVAAPTVRVLFEATGSRFTAADTLRVSQALIYYAAGIWAYSMQHVLIRAFYAQENSRSPVRIAAVMVCVNLVLNLVLVRRMGESGVALATAVTASAQVVFLMIRLRVHLGRVDVRSVAMLLVRVMAATVVMGAIVWVLQGKSPLGELLPGGDFLKLPVCVVAGALAFWVVASTLKIEELHAIRMRRSRVTSDAMPDDSAD